MNINSTKGRNLNLTNEENQMNINERPHSNARVRHITPDIISSRVIPNQVFHPLREFLFYTLTLNRIISWGKFQLKKVFRFLMKQTIW